MKLLQQQSAPPVGIDEFDGNPLNFTYFLATFHEAVEKKIDDPRGRLMRLIKYTNGEANELIKNCIQEDSYTGYEHAMTLLKTHYGNPHIIARAYIKELRKWESLKSGDSKAFRKFYAFLVKCKACMSSGQYLKELNFPDILQVLQSKLPFNLQDKWNRRAVKIRTYDDREANFDDFMRIVETEMIVSNDPMYSREAMSDITNTKNNNNNNKNNPQNKLSNFSVALGLENKVNEHVRDGIKQVVKLGTSNEDVVPARETKVRCVYCQQSHDIDDCSEYDKLSMKDRKAFIFRKRLCFSCLKSVSPAHTSKTCKNKRKCTKCNEQHPSCLHIDTEVDTEVENIVETDIPIVSAATGCDKDLDEEKCEVKNKTISLCIIPVQVRHGLNPDNVMTVYAMLDNCSEGTFLTDEIAESLTNPPELGPTVQKLIASDPNITEELIFQQLAHSIGTTTTSLKTLNLKSNHPSCSVIGLTGFISSWL